jgi:hypothetical protein
MKDSAKPKSQRVCPALQGPITPQECGAKRGSAITCTADCKHNPFAPGNEKDFARLEKRVLEMMKDRVFEELPFESRAKFAEKMEDLEDELSQQTMLIRELLLKHDARGHSLLERWSEECSEEFSNDERNFLGCYLTLRPALLEVHEIKESGMVEVVDLLEEKPTPRLLSDATAAAQACRFTTLFGWVYATPFYLRLSGGACMMDDCGEDSQAENLRVIAEHLGCRAQAKAFRGWLADHFMRVCDSIGAVQTARWEQLMQAAEDEPAQLEYDADLVPPALLEDLKVVIKETEAPEENDEAAAFDADADEDQVASFHTYYRTYADRPLGLLEGLSPRAASANAALRPRLIELMKKHVPGLDQTRREQGLDLDLNGLLQELGLTEIVFPPAPLGEPMEFEDEVEEEEMLPARAEGEPVIPMEDADDEDDFDDEFDPIGSLHDTDWHDMPGFNDEPPPPQAALSEAELEHRRSALDASPDDLHERWRKTWPDLHEVALDLTDGLLREASLPAALNLLAALTCVLHPQRPAGYEFNAARFGWRFSQELQQLETLMVDHADPDVALQTYLDDSPQPVLAHWICNEALDAAHGHRAALTEDEAFAVIPFLKAALWELSHAVN